MKAFGKKVFDQNTSAVSHVGRGKLFHNVTQETTGPLEGFNAEAKQQAKMGAKMATKMWGKDFIKNGGMRSSPPFL